MKRPFREHNWRYWGMRRRHGPITEWDGGDKVWKRGDTFMVQGGEGWTFSNNDISMDVQGPADDFNPYEDLGSGSQVRVGGP